MATSIKRTPTGKLFSHPENPRYILDENFDKLKRSLEQFPDMMEKRPLIINDQFQVLGGNMRLKAAIALGWKHVHTIQVDWGIEKQREFIIKDNSGFGNWDFDVLANEWNQDELAEWGLEVYLPDENDLDGFFEDDENGDKPHKYIIVLEFANESQLTRVKEALANRDGANEDIVLGLLGL